MVEMGEGETLDPMERLLRLRHRALSLSRTIGAVTNSTMRYRGRDDSGNVVLTARGNGQVESVGIDEHWFSRRGTSEVGPALLAAYRAAMAEVLAGMAERIEAMDGDTSPLPVPEPVAAPRQPYRRLTFDDVAEALRDLDRKREAAETTRRPAEADVDERRTYRGPHGLVTITTQGGDLSEITVDGYLARSQVRLLAQDAVAAFAALGAKA